MNYKEALNYIRNIERAGSDYGIERMRELLLLLGEPQNGLRFVHVAGTNGKGSVTAYLSAVFCAAGLKTGVYNSPSVFSYNERWLINGNPLSDDDVAKYIGIVAQTIDNEQKLRSVFGAGDFSPTAFEIETAVAILAFYDKGCDACVLETGLGGRWDATNAIDEKQLAVITPIGLDHCALLGNTLGEIASEKAAIIQDTAVTCEQDEEIIRELKRPYRFIDGKREYYDSDLWICAKPKLVKTDLTGQTFMYEGEKYQIRMLGEHQLTNAAIAICSAKQLIKKHWGISPQAIKEGLANAVWHGRFEVVDNAFDRFKLLKPNNKLLILDGAHNPHGAKALAQSIRCYLQNKRITLVIGVLSDKDVDGILCELVPFVQRMIAVTPPSPRALDCNSLRAKIESVSVSASKPILCDCADSVRNGVEQALSEECDTVIVCGSLTLFAALTSDNNQISSIR